MGKDGVYFVALVLFVALLTGTLGPVIVTILTVGFVYAVICWTLKNLANADKKVFGKTLPKPIPTSNELLVFDLPKPIDSVVQKIKGELEEVSESYQEVITTFLVAIGYHTSKLDHIDPMWFNAIELKAMYEYYNKYGSLSLEHLSKGGVTKEEILRTLQNSEKECFTEFCKAHSI